MTKSLLVLCLLLSAPAFGATFGRSVDVNKLSTIAETMVRPISALRVTWCVIEGGATEETVIFRGVGGTPEYSRVTVPAGTNLSVKLAQNVNVNGLEVVTVDAAGDISVGCTVRVIR